MQIDTGTQTDDDREELASQAWRLLLGVGQRRLDAVTASMEEMGLSKVMAQFLGAVCQLPPGPTNQLANHFGVDPGWVTDIVDRLEARGDLVRRTSPSDRRVKILEVTPAGRKTYEALEGWFAAPPAELLDVPREDLQALLRVAQRLAGATPEGETAPR